MANRLDGCRAAILVTDGFEEVELAKPRQALDDAGAQTSIVSPKDGTVRSWRFTDWGQEFPVDVRLNDARPEEFDAHLEMANREHGPLMLEEQALYARLEQAFAALDGTYCNFCHACLPCPEDVAIPEILRLRNLSQAYGMDDFGRYRYKMFVHKDAQTGEPVGGAGHWFPGRDATFCTDCGDCLPRCPQNLSIPLLLRETHDRLSGEVGKRLWADE